MSKSLLARYNAQVGIQCQKCGGLMRTGQALEPIMSGKPDFIGDDFVCTMSPTGKARLVSCIKCEACGWSVK